MCVDVYVAVISVGRGTMLTFTTRVWSLALGNVAVCVRAIGSDFIAL